LETTICVYNDDIVCIHVFLVFRSPSTKADALDQASSEM